MTPTRMRPEDCLARVQGTFSVRGLNGPVSILRDRWGIPHIRAGSSDDALFGQGYATAQDRLFQLELRRHQARGTAAGFINRGFLGQDRANRKNGFARDAEREWAVQPPEVRRLLEAYSAGINAVIATQPRPYEFELLDHEMGPWSPVDTLAIMKLVAQGNQWSARIRRAKLLAAKGFEVTLHTLPDTPPGMSLITPSGATWESMDHPYRDYLAKGLDEPEGPIAAGGGSNCWVVDGAHSTTGAPIVCGDPHLTIRIPAEWHVMHMECPEFNVAGPCTPGAPGPLYYGHNTRVAWTMTHGGGDRWDVYREKVRLEASRPHSLFRDAWEPLFRRDETYAVRDGEPITETDWETRHGFVVMGDPLKDQEVLAARWAMSEPGFDFVGLLKLYAAGSTDEAREAFRQYDSISGNYCFADQAGNIGYQYTGRLPKRPPYLVPVAGWDGEHEWDGWVEKSELPWQENPPNGYIATANNRPAGADYPHYIALGGAPWRADRLNELLRSKPKWSPADMVSIQGDLVSPVARLLTARYLAVAGLTDAARRLQGLIRGWDCRVAVDSSAALVYMEITQQLIALTVASIDDDDSNAETPDRRGLLLRVLRLDDPAFLADFGSWDEAIARAMTLAAEGLVAKYGADESQWKWGRAHWMTWRHNLGRDPEMAAVFNLPDTPVGGDGATLWATQARYGRGSDHGVSYRQIFDMANLNGAPIVMPPGNSGQPGSAHYADSLALWEALAYHPLYFEWPDIEANSEAELLLQPES